MMLVAAIMHIVSMSEDVSLPLSELMFPDMLFTCRESDYATVGIDYDKQHRRMDFNIVGDRWAVANFKDPIKSVFLRIDGPNKSWKIHASGIPSFANGKIANGTPVVLDMTIRQTPPHKLVADFTVQAGEYHLAARNCEIRPSSYHSLEAVQ